MLFERPILTAAEMRAAEQRAIDAGTSVETLMERAGAAAAEAIWRFAGPLPALILCGPGNNGGDGHVIARILKERGVDVTVATLADSPEAEPRPLLIDALFGTGLKRGLDAPIEGKLLALAAAAKVKVAIDLPSGAATDDGQLLSQVPDYDLTITFGAPKPAHFLQPAARHMRRLVTADIGVKAESRLHLIGRPRLTAAGPDDHKYSRGYVAVIAGEMPGASALTATAAARAGAGYVRLLGKPIAGILQSIVQGSDDPALLDDRRIGCIAIGPGLGRTAEAGAHLDAHLATFHPLVLDADALFLLESPKRLAALSETTILTPHAGEFARLFGDLPGSKIDQARRAAEQSGSVLLFKGPDTVIAAPDDRAAILPPAPAWLASAGTGDVLTGIIAAMRAGGTEAFEAACAGAWLHRRAAELAGPGLIADDLITALPAAVAECL
ncbi:MAG TPA: NAD(P)H-hydrate dehydratase [Allosphingosinicella sp.]|uniref:NAD(P)H-hydrate dehydratase n=1 Tax=Allosphingosinicella sp. TaxID=2823234 RepID=UPI002ED98F98